MKNQVLHEAGLNESIIQRGRLPWNGIARTGTPFQRVWSGRSWRGHLGRV